MAYERRIKVTHGIDDCYKFYRQNYPIPLDPKTYKTIVYELNQIISNLIIQESFEYRIPHGLGFLRIKKKKLIFKLFEGKIDVNKNVIDWKKSWDYWKKIFPDKSIMEIKKTPGKKVFFQTNDHTNGEIMRWYWDKRISKVKNISLYSFRPVKGGKNGDIYTGRRGLSKWINSRERKNEYYY